MAEKKRGVGRPPKNAPPAKRVRTSAAAAARVPTPKEQTPVVEVVEQEREPTPLPNKIIDSKALPTLSEAQSLDLPNDEYQSISASGILAASLERSRQKWISGSFFEKYWTKTSTRKDAPPPPPNNPMKVWMKDLGTVTITIEPLILEAMVFYVKEPGMAGPVLVNQPQQRPPPPQVQYRSQTPTQPNPPSISSISPSPYGTPYRPQSAQHHFTQPNPQYQSRTHPPVSRPASSPMPVAPDTRFLPPIMPANTLPPPVAPRPPPPPTPAPAQQNKASPDPVIQMLATRASSDHQLKSLMKVVATGHANQEQLRIFQRHIDELTAIINRNKAQQAQQQQQQQQQQHQQQHHQPMNPMSGTPVHAQPGPYNSNAPSRTSTPGITGPPQLLPRPGPVATPPPPQQQQPQRHPNQYTTNSSQPQPRPQQYPVQPPREKYYPPGQQPSLPVVIEFHGPGASPDRFKFPEYSILEFLSPHMLLVSFLVIRKAKLDTRTGLVEGAIPEDADKIKEDNAEVKSGDIYEPITLKITVDESQKGRDILGFIQRSVKPPVETRAWMTEQIARCMRAQRRYLALRLPHKSQIRETSEDATKESTPIVPDKKRAAPRKSLDKKTKDKEEEKEKENDNVGSVAPSQNTASAEAEKGDAAVTVAATPSVPASSDGQEAQATEGAPTEPAVETVPVGRRSSRKKSVRISDAHMTDA